MARGNQGVLNVFLGRNRQADLAEFLGHIVAKIGKFIGARTDHHGGAANPFPRHDPTANAGIGAKMINQAYIRRLGGEIGNHRVVLPGERLVQLLLRDHAIGQQNIAKTRFFTALQLYRALKVNLRKDATFMEDFAQQGRTRAHLALWRLNRFRRLTMNQSQISTCHFSAQSSLLGASKACGWLTFD